MASLVADADSQHDAAKKSSALLSGTVGSAAARIMSNMQGVIQQLHEVLRNAEWKVDDSMKSLEAHRHTMTELLESDALKALGSMAEADRKAEDAGIVNAQYLHWIDMYHSNEDAFRASIEQTLMDAGVLTKEQEDALVALSKERKEQAETITSS